MKRVVVTGLGVISNLGRSLPEFWEKLLQGEMAFNPPEGFDASAYRANRILALAPETFAQLKADPRFSPDMTLYGRLGVWAAQQALAQAGLENTGVLSRAGLYLGTTTFGMFDRRTYQPGDDFADWVLDRIQFMLESDIRKMAEHLALAGPLTVFSSACTSGLVSVAQASDLIALGDANVMLAGGIDIIQELAFAGFNSLRLATKDLCRPFDANRKGIVMGEGSAIVVLEEYEHARGRGAKILAEVKGIGLSCDAQHVTAPNAEGAARAMRAALRSAQLEPGGIDYINCHGTGTMLNDKAEMEAIDRVFGRRPDLVANSTKAVTGHWLGTAGSLEFVITVQALASGTVPPAMNIENLDPGVGFVVNQGASVQKNLRAVMTNAFGFGGNNASMILAGCK